MKILPVEKIRQADAYTIQNEPVNSIDLMERAAKACVDYVIKKWEKSQTIKLFCGLGNNGGDGLAIARLLQQNGFNPEVFITSFSDKFSSDFATNLERIKDTTNVAVTWLKQDTPLPRARLKMFWLSTVSSDRDFPNQWKAMLLILSNTSTKVMPKYFR